MDQTFVSSSFSFHLLQLISYEIILMLEKIESKIQKEKEEENQRQDDGQRPRVS